MAKKLSRYREVADELRGEILEGRLAPGSRLLSMVELQARFNIARATSDKVFAELEREGLVVRRRGSGTFVAPPAAAPASGLLGYFGTGSRVPKGGYNAELMAGVEQAVLNAGHGLVLLKDRPCSGWDKVQGVVLQHPSYLPDVLHHLGPGTPCVMLLNPAAGYCSVLADDFGGVCSAVEHLVELGHRRIAYLLEPLAPLDQGLTSKEWHWTRGQRHAAYLSSLHRHGIEPLAQWVYVASLNQEPKRPYRAWAYDTLGDWLREGWDTECTALLVQNDQAAIGALQALHDAGYDVPGQVSVVGFDGTAICDCVEPSLTSVGVPLYKIGARAAQLLLTRIASPEQEPENVVLPTQLQVRKSTAAPPRAGVPRSTGEAGSRGDWGARLALRENRLLDLLEGVR